MPLMPSDWAQGTFVGRADFGEGPSPILVLRGELIDMSGVVPTVSALVEAGDFSGAGGVRLGAFDAAAVNLLSPVDLQCVKACGVTFATSAIERVIEERARGDWSAAAAIRERLEARIGGQIRSVVPGSDSAAQLKAALIEDGLWSQYLEVAIGPDAEVFTKSPVLSTMGVGAEIGVRSDSSWNNPEPEIALLVGSDGKAVGATLGNDVNLRDFEGRSALLLGKAKDNNASCALGPLVRLFDESFTIDHVRDAEVRLSITGEDGFVLSGKSNMAEISRDPLDLVRQTLSEHQYPDGFVLFLGTLFAPVQDRDEEGRGFTHKVGDVVTIESDRLGQLTNRVVTSRDAAPWSTGIGAFYANLLSRGLLKA
ncbi:MULTISPECIES: fumarylacetoacetate hydrolase family protein [Novosphingobium]|uniref:fumarylacetoacetate hydrolase family protein n=1 Tax=Novosphingobium sp. RL4 TaxID=3109595 RepID=UPI00163D91C6|nr:fumarylacetoacetate hydrolase family protein [Novosphingobium sp. RL4]WRT94792.1 fumarylacetoacetate hydrolase family protein [Novosphingobium sp. RL4]WRT95713.1 fumarylacetoacetate hydrolase family protein [Novosphingobium sp. RL4]